jgi:hypothetical protein
MTREQEAVDHLRWAIWLVKHAAKKCAWGASDTNRIASVEAFLAVTPPPASEPPKHAYVSTPNSKHCAIKQCGLPVENPCHYGDPDFMSASEPTGNPGQLPKTPTCGRCGHPLSPCHQGEVEPCGLCGGEHPCPVMEAIDELSAIVRPTIGVGLPASSPASDTGEATHDGWTPPGVGLTSEDAAPAPQPRDRIGCVCPFPRVRCPNCSYVCAECATARLPPVSSEPVTLPKPPLCTDPDCVYQDRGGHPAGPHGHLPKPPDTPPAGYSKCPTKDCPRWKPDKIQWCTTCWTNGTRSAMTTGEADWIPPASNGSKTPQPSPEEASDRHAKSPSGPAEPERHAFVAYPDGQFPGVCMQCARDPYNDDVHTHAFLQWRGPDGAVSTWCRSCTYTVDHPIHTKGTGDPA